MWPAGHVAAGPVKPRNATAPRRFSAFAAPRLGDLEKVLDARSAAPGAAEAETLPAGEVLRGKAGPRAG